MPGILGLEEVVRRMDEHQKTQTRILERIERIEQEQAKIWEELKAIREEQANKEDFNKLHEEQVRLREDFNRMLARIEALEAGQVELRRGQEELREEQVRLREDFNRMLAGVEALEGSVAELRVGQRRLESIVLVGFDGLRGFVGVAFEEFVREVLSGSLRGMSVLPDGARLRREVIDGEEVNLFYEDPLIVGGNGVC